MDSDDLNNEPGHKVEARLGCGCPNDFMSPPETFNASTCRMTPMRAEARLYSAADFYRDPAPAPSRPPLLHRLARVPMIQRVIRRVWKAAWIVWNRLEDYRIPE